MPTLPWINRNEKPKDATNSMVAMLTYLPLKHWWDTPRFMIYVVQIYLQLRRTPGLQGFSMRAHPFTKHYWTLSLWESEQAMHAYIHTAPHLIIMKKMQGKMGRTAFTQWSMADPHTPPTWSDALTRPTQNY